MDEEIEHSQKAIDFDDDELLECEHCHSMALKKREDGSYICTVCHAQGKFAVTFNTIDTLEGQEGAGRTYSIQSQSAVAPERKNLVVFAEILQLMLAIETVAFEQRFGIDLSGVIQSVIKENSSLFTRPFKKGNFRVVPMMLLAGISRLEIPISPADIVRWIKDGYIPYTDPLSFLPSSFISLVSPQEKVLFDPPLFNVSKLFSLALKTQPLFTLPNPLFVIWRAGAYLGLPELHFTAFCEWLREEEFPKILKKEDHVYMEKYIKRGFALPLSLVLLALTCIYKLDGTDYVHPMFSSNNYPSFTAILQTIADRNGVEPLFPYIKVNLPGMFRDVMRILSDSDPINIHVHAVSNPVRTSFGKGFQIPTPHVNKATLSNDLNFVVTAFSNEFGVPEHYLIAYYDKMLATITKNKLQSKG